MRPVFVLAMTLAAVLGAWSTAARAQSWQPPTEDQRCPSKWGAGDERGSGNHMTPETVLRAAQLIRTGETFELGHVLSGELPFYGNRRFYLSRAVLAHMPTHGPAGFRPSAVANQREPGLLKG